MNEPTLFLQTGRAGDILNALPLAQRHMLKTGERPLFMVAKAYAELLEGVSYVQPVIFEGEFTDTLAAIFKARQLTSNVVVSQIYGKAISNREMCTSFARESWAAANSDVPWGTLPLLIDKRDTAREAALLAKHWPRVAGPVVLTALRGTSSPFPFARDFAANLPRMLGKEFTVVDISGVKAERFYDLLGLFDRAACLVTIDTGHLHLAHASDVPVVALITRSPSRWHGSPWRPNHAGRFYYDEFPAVMSGAVAAIKAAVASAERPRLVHTWADWRRDWPDAETCRRMDVAEASWAMEYAAAPGYWRPAKFNIAARDSTHVGDTMPIPFLKDVLEHAASFCRTDSDVIAFTNSDVCFAPGITGHVLEHMTRNGCAFTHRWDFDRLYSPFATEGMVRKGKFYPGSDAFFFTRAWWREHGWEYPDMLLGREKNDEVLRQLIKLHGGEEIEACIYHEKHRSFWEARENFESNRGNIYNRQLATKWFINTGLTENDFIWWTKCTDRRTR